MFKGFFLAELSLIFSLSLSAAQTDTAKIDEKAQAECERKKLRQNVLHSFDNNFEKSLTSIYTSSQLRLLKKLKKPCTKNTEWPDKRNLILYALTQKIHPDDMMLVTIDFPDGRWTKRNRPLPAAVATNDLTLAQKLLQYKADPNQCSHRGDYSVLFGVTSPEMAQLLLAYKADATCRGVYDESLLHSNEHRSPSSAVALLFFKAGADMRVISKHFNHSVLMDSILHGCDFALISLSVRLGSPLQTQSRDFPYFGKNYQDIIKAIKITPDFWLKTIEQAQQEVAQAAKEHNDEVEIILKCDIGIDRDSTSLIVAYAQEHVIPPSAKKLLEEINHKYPLEIAKLPNYNQEEPKEKRRNCFRRLLGC